MISTLKTAEETQTKAESQTASCESSEVHYTGVWFIITASIG